MRYMMMHGKMVLTHPFPKPKFDMLVADAKHIIQVAERGQPSKLARTGKRTVYFAHLILNMQWPIVQVWDGKDWFIVSSHKLEQPEAIYELAN